MTEDVGRSLLEDMIPWQRKLNSAVSGRLVLRAAMIQVWADLSMPYDLRVEMPRKPGWVGGIRAVTP